MTAVATQAARFFTVGGAATVVHVACALGLHSLFGVAPLIANVFAFLVASAVSYIGNWRWTFGTSGEHAHAVPRFLLIAISAFGVNQFTVFLLVEKLGYPFWIGLIPAVLIVPVVTFWLNWTRVFRSRV